MLLLCSFEMQSAHQKEINAMEGTYGHINAKWNQIKRQGHKQESDKNVTTHGTVQISEAGVMLKSLCRLISAPVQGRILNRF